METSSAESRMATAKTIVSAAASVAATLMLVRSIANDFLPHELRNYFFFNAHQFFSRFSSTVTMVIDEFDGLVYNQIYEAAQTYLGTKISPSTKRFRVSKPEKEKNFVVAMESNEEVEDIFSGVKFKWVFVCRQVEDRGFSNPHDIGSTLRSEVRSFQLCFHKKHREMVLDSYLPYIVQEAKSMVQERKTLKIFTVEFEKIHYSSGLSDAWKSVNLDHPATFETLAMEPGLKDTIVRDLERFVRRKDYYRKVGKAWKRGYLLYGPPGTGKSSLIAAMANYLNFDVYDLELTELRCNSDLRKLLVATANRSILVVEDIDCTIELQNRATEGRVYRNGYPLRQEQVTLSGLLNFIDGLWSSCGDERIIIFTTNHKEKLDPALLRPGRMDVHIHMSYCTPCGFKVLAANYLGIKDHQLFPEIEEAIGSTEVTPAEVAEQLMRSDDLDALLNDLIEFLKVKKIENEEAKAKKAQTQAQEEREQNDDEKETTED
ncbi:hypothetical protein SLA2020_133810 [Shorea laevis]